MFTVCTQTHRTKNKHWTKLQIEIRVTARLFVTCVSCVLLLGSVLRVFPVVVCSLRTQLRLFMSHLITNPSVVFFQITFSMVSSYRLLFLAPSSSSSIALVSLAKFVLFLLNLIHFVVTVRFVPLRFSAHVCFVGSLPSSDWPTLYRTLFLYPSSPNCLLHSTVSNFLHQILVHTVLPFRLFNTKYSLDSDYQSCL